MRYYILTLRQLSTGFVRHRRVYWNTLQYDHYLNRLNEPIADIEILKIEAIEE